jgi:hypothetical protein
MSCRFKYTTEKNNQPTGIKLTNRAPLSSYVGTVHQHPDAWIIVGLFYPPWAEMDDLFGLFG